MKKLFEAVRIARRSLTALFVAIAAVSAYGRTVSVSSMARNSQGRLTANLALSTGDTAVLYVAYGATDGGSDFDAWDTRRPVAMVAGDTTSYTYTLPSDLGDDVVAVRFFLLEDYDIPLTKRYDYIQTDGSQYVETSFTPSGLSAVEMGLSLNSVASSVALCCARRDSMSTDSFTAFYITGSGWRFDYYAIGSAVSPVAVVDQPYTVRLERTGLYLDGTCISSRTPVSTVSRRSLLLFCAKTGDSPADGNYRASLKLYSLKAWANSADATSIALDLIPTEHEGEACFYNRIDGTYLKGARSGYPLGHGDEVPVNRPSVVASSDSRNISGIWYVDCRNGNDANPGISALPKQTIRAATTNALSGDIIRVAPGTYGALEGSQTWPNASATIDTRVVIPAGVTLESTEGAEKTIIVGAPSPNPEVTEGAFAGLGPGAVRCVAADTGATLRGFTLTGGYTLYDSSSSTRDASGAAFTDQASAERTETIEDCIVSNNVSRYYTVRCAVVRRCRVIGNTADAGSAGFSSLWYGSIINSNTGNKTLYNSMAIESCTIGGGNTQTNGTAATVFYYDTGTDRTIVNSVLLVNGRLSVAAHVYCTNCIAMQNLSSSANVTWHNTIFTEYFAGAQVDSEYRPVLGSNMGIDAGDASVSSAALGDTDIYGTPRILNGAIDIGAVEHDWRPTFAAELGRRFTMTYASPSVTTNATGGLRLDGDVGTLGERALPVCIAGMATSAGPYEFRFEMTGGSAQVYVGGVLAGEASGAGAQSIRFDVPDAAAEIRFTFTPDTQNLGAAILRKFAGARGFSVTIR